MTPEQRQNSQLAASWATFTATVIGISTILFYIGRKDQQLDFTTSQVKELGEIVSELAKAQIGLAMKDQQVDDRLRELVQRLERLERNRQ